MTRYPGTAHYKTYCYHESAQEGIRHADGGGLFVGLGLRHENVEQWKKMIRTSRNCQGMDVSKVSRVGVLGSLNLRDWG